MAFKHLFQKMKQLLE